MSDPDNPKKRDESEKYGAIVKAFRNVIDMFMEGRRLIVLAGLLPCVLVLARARAISGNMELLTTRDIVMVVIAIVMPVIIWALLRVVDDRKSGSDLQPETGNNLHVIAWEGMEHTDLYKDAGTLPGREFLLVRGSLEDLPALTFQHSGVPARNDFVSMVCDIEFLKGYTDAKRLYSISTLEGYSDLVRKLNPVIKKEAELSLEWGIPIRFGFQEILIHEKRVERGFFLEVTDLVKHGPLSYEKLGHGETPQ